MPSAVTIHKHFGTYRELYNRLGYRVGAQYIHKSDQAERTLHLRETLANELRGIFPEHVAKTQLPGKKRTLLWIDDSFAVIGSLCVEMETWKVHLDSVSEPR